MKTKAGILTMIMVLTMCTYGCSSDDEAAVTTEETNGIEIISEYDFEFTDRDMDSSYDEAEAVFIQLADDSVFIDCDGVTVDGDIITISSEGTYVLSGELNDGQIVIAAGEEDKVQLVLDGVSINNSSGAAIYVESGDKVFVTLTDGSENALSSTGASDETDAVINSNSDLTLNGTGSVTITTFDGNGITSKDDLVITEGTYKINASERGLEANDRILIADGTFYIVAGDDGIHCENDDDDTLGYVYIKDGEFDIIAEDDGIHGTANVTVDGGDILIEEAYEGIEGQTIVINGSTIDIYTEDDGINCAGGNDGSNSDGPGADEFSALADAYVIITGGVININADGDGLDSNGDLYISGGEIYVSGPESEKNGALDFNGEGIISGGTIIATGSSNMVQNFEDGSTQGSILIVGDEFVEGDIELLSADGEVLLTYSPDKAYSSVVISSPDIEEGNTYYINMGDTSVEVQMDALIYG